MNDAGERFHVVHQRVIELLEQGKVVYSRHADEKRALRSISTPDIEHVIRWGQITEVRTSPEYPSPSYTIRGRSLDEENLVCAVAIEGDCLLVVTIHRSHQVRIAQGASL